MKSQKGFFAPLVIFLIVALALLIAFFTFTPRSSQDETAELSAEDCSIPFPQYGIDCEQFRTLAISKNPVLKDRRVTSVYFSGVYYIVEAEKQDFVPHVESREEGDISLFVGDKETLKLIDNDISIIASFATLHAYKVDRILVNVLISNSESRTHLIDATTFETIPISDPNNLLGDAAPRLLSDKGFFMGNFNVGEREEDLRFWGYNQSGPVALTIDLVTGEVTDYQINPAY